LNHAAGAWPRSRVHLADDGVVSHLRLTLMITIVLPNGGRG
jgi:hypothetical protein